MSVLYVRQFPERLYKEIRKSAKEHHRSISQEVIYLLEEKLELSAHEGVWAKMSQLREKAAKYGTFEDSARMLRKDRER